MCEAMLHLACITALSLSRLDFRPSGRESRINCAVLPSRSVRWTGTGITLVRWSDFSKPWPPLSNETCNFPRLPGTGFRPHTRIRLETGCRSFATHTNARKVRASMNTKTCGGDLMISAFSSTIDRLSDACLQAASILMQLSHRALRV